MKKIIVVLVAAMSLMTSLTSLAEEEPVKWQVDITIRYNAVSKGEAIDIADRVLSRNGKACTAKILVKKVTQGFLFVDSATLLDASPNYFVMD